MKKITNLNKQDDVKELQAIKEKTLEPTITFPHPQITAINLFSSMYDFVVFQCQEGVDMLKRIEGIVGNYINKVYPKLSKKGVSNLKKDQNNFLHYSMNSIVDGFSALMNTNCDAFVKSSVRFFRRSIFLLSLKYLHL